MKTVSQEKNKQAEQLYDQLYQKYGRPLEKRHKGEYLAVSYKGQTILGQDLLSIVKKASNTFGPANSLVYKVGQKYVGKWLQIK